MDKEAKGGLSHLNREISQAFGFGSRRKKPSKPGPKVSYLVNGWECIASNAVEACRLWAVEENGYPEGSHNMIDVRQLGPGYYRLELQGGRMGSTVGVRRIGKKG